MAAAANQGLKVIILIILSPLILAFLALGISVWLVATVTFIGPGLQILRCREDARKLAEVAKSSELRRVKSPGGYFLCYRLLLGQSTSKPLSPPVDQKSPLLSSAKAGVEAYSAVGKYDEKGASQPRKYPIVIPGGLAATMFTTNKMQEALAASGFTVLAFDRLGVGLSDRNTTGVRPTVEEVVRDMDLIMRDALPDAKQWIILGPSMGSIVAQCFMLSHPDKIVGLLNLDGFPHPFAERRNMFEKSAKVYRVLSTIMWTGLPRFILALPPVRTFFKKFETKLSPASIIAAQMNQPAFFGNVGIEMGLMIDLAQAASKGWGKLSVQTLSKEDLNTLLRLPPTNNGELNESCTWVTLPRSRNEHGEDWLKADDDEAKTFLQRLRSWQDESELGSIFKKIAVRVLCARTYDDNYFDSDMKDWSGGEHALHQYSAGDGARFIFPNLDHGKMFLLEREMALCAVELDNAVPLLS